jgi:hypothetical protein
MRDSSISVIIGARCLGFESRLQLAPVRTVFVSALTAVRAGDPCDASDAERAPSIGRRAQASATGLTFTPLAPSPSSIRRGLT